MDLHGISCARRTIEDKLQSVCDLNSLGILSPLPQPGAPDGRKSFEKKYLEVKSFVLKYLEGYIYCNILKIKGVPTK